MYRHMSPAAFSGSWAGAMGQVQFMPSSFLNTRSIRTGMAGKDLWGNLADVFGSAANYLHQNGWREDQTWGRRVRVPDSSTLPCSGLRPASRCRPGRHWGAATGRFRRCLRPTCRPPSFGPMMSMAAVILLYDNYRVLRHWNPIPYFVVAVGTWRI